jgi:hypothetical protein
LEEPAASLSARVRQWGAPALERWAKDGSRVKGLAKATAELVTAKGSARSGLEAEQFAAPAKATAELVTAKASAGSRLGVGWSAARGPAKELGAVWSAESRWVGRPASEFPIGRR